MSNRHEAELLTEQSFASKRRQELLALMSQIRADATLAQVAADSLNDIANALADLASDMRAVEGKIEDALQPYATRNYLAWARSQVPGSY